MTQDRWAIEEECRRFVTEGKKVATVAKQRTMDSGMTVTQVCSPVKSFAQQVGWLKVIFAAGVALVAAGVAAAVYTDQFATNEDVSVLMNEHSRGPGHPGTEKVIRDVQDRLIRIELQQDVMGRVQGAMDNKLDRLIERSTAPAWLVPPAQSRPIP